MARPVSTAQTRKGPAKVTKGPKGGLTRAPELPAGAPATVDIAGDPKDQCFKFEIRDKTIQAGWSAVLNESGACVKLSSAVVAMGSAVFVVCCEKDAAGKCKNCVKTFQLQLLEPVPAMDATILRLSQNATITCSP